MPRLSRELLIRGIAYRMQEQARGSLSGKVVRRLEQIARGANAARCSGASASVARAGMRLVREWQGRAHEVVVLEDGFLWNGKAYRSLSEIARLITGTRWSGPRFFGLQDERRKESTAMGERTSRRMRCAIYTRKSSEEGLEQAFNSLHAQREACEAYMKSQQHEGWSVYPHSTTMAASRAARWSGRR